MAQPHNYPGCFDEDILDCIAEELIVQTDKSFNFLSSFLFTNEASMPFTAVLPMGGSAFAISSQAVRCSDSNTNSNNITHTTNMGSMENTGFDDGSMVVEGAMSSGG